MSGDHKSFRTKEVQEMKREKRCIHSQLHTLEDGLIQIDGLVRALKRVQPDDGPSACITNAIEDRLAQLQEQFYEHWRALSNKGDPSGPGPNGTEENAICMRQETPKKHVK